MKLLNDFQSKSGKYAIPGYPHKLGLLLHGPPGTGKTSLIKARPRPLTRPLALTLTLTLSLTLTLA